MKPEVFVLCDAATDSQGKLNLLGAFDTIFASSLPAKHPHCAIAARIRFSPSEGGEHSFRVTLADSSSRNLLPPFEGKVQLQFQSPDQPTRWNLIINIGGLQFESFGAHTLNLEVDGNRLAVVPFHVSKIAGQTVPPRT
jgi:hypothetical protein